VGDRGNIEVKSYNNQPSVFLYTHWSGTSLPAILASALKRGRDRWEDPTYLTRIIFCEMVKDELMDTTGYGISSTEGDSNHDLIVVDPINKTVNRNHSFEDWIAFHLPKEG
jgi:hypothetical protein